MSYLIFTLFNDNHLSFHVLGKLTPDFLLLSPLYEYSFQGTAVVENITPDIVQ